MSLLFAYEMSWLERGLEEQANQNPIQVDSSCGSNYYILQLLYPCKAQAHETVYLLQGVQTD